ncbi:MFS transporter [Demequina sp. NBRC 110055]|uniref:MFS transporter n=1 Tax=Demequina sp. NBRC 110055 TaxID=1570344 RepID=UPI000A07729E|nr:MFS transporter [Demequina sp. NBRC 110055]
MSTSTPAATTPEQRTVLWIAILASFVSFLDGTVVNVALPAIVDDLGGGITTQQWTVDAYLITLGALMLVAGSISDTYGRLRVIRWGLIGFGVTSVAIALAPTAPFLIVARLLQGVAGALLVPSSLALIMANFRGRAQGKAIGTWTAATSGAMVAGPVIGGLLIDLANWRWVFLINVVPIALTLWLLTRLEQRDVQLPDAHIDMISAALGAIGLGGMVFALIEEPNLGWGHPQIWLTGAVGVSAFVAFVWRQAVVERPMLPLSLFRARNFAWGNLATFMIYGALSLNGFVLTVYLQESAGLSATAAGLASLPITVIMILLSSQVGSLAGRLGPRLFMTAGPLMMAAGSLLMLTVSDDFSYWTQVLPGIVLFGLGLTVTVSPLTSAILGAIETERSGIASATNNAISRVAGLVTIALVGAIVGGALDLDGFHRAMWATAILMAVGGIVSWLGIRNPVAPDED